MKKDLKYIDDNWIFQNNTLISISEPLTLMEEQLIRLLASMVQPNDDSFKEYSFDSSDLIRLFNTSRSRFYRDIDATTDRLMERVVTFKDKNDTKFKKYHYVETAEYENGVLTLKISSDMQKFYLHLHQYTKYQLKNVLRFKSVFSFKLYEQLKQYQKIGYRKYSINEFKRIMGVDDKYPNYANLKVRVIQKAMSEINAHTDIQVTLEEETIKRKVIGVKFNIECVKIISPYVLNEEFTPSSKYKKKELKFTNYTQRNRTEEDMKQLEYKLLGWD